MDASGDDTVILRPARRRAGRGPIRLLLAGLVVIGLAAGLGWWALGPAPPRFTIRTAGLATILANTAPGLTVFRFAPNRAVLVLDFSSMEEQGLMLDRVAALVEKAGEPHGRVLTTAELDRAIRASGDTIATYYYGHDYSAAELARFFALARAEHRHLRPQEKALRALLRQAGYLKPGAVGAVISLPHAGAIAGLDGTMRRAILVHELSHGELFTTPAYHAYAERFWNGPLGAQGRAIFTAFLGRQGYDTTLHLLMVNETQAYMNFTPDPRLFNAAALGVPPARLDAWRAAYLAGMAPGWLRTLDPFATAR